MMPNKIEIQINADDMPIPNKPHVAYFDMPNEMIVAIKYVADFSAEGVNVVDVLGVEAVYDNGNNDLSILSYTLTPEDASYMASLISQMILNANENKIKIDTDAATKEADMSTDKSVTLEVTEPQLNEIIKSISSYSKIQEKLIGMGRPDVNDNKKRQLIIDKNTKLIELLEKSQINNIRMK